MLKSGDVPKKVVPMCKIFFGSNVLMGSKVNANSKSLEIILQKENYH